MKDAFLILALLFVSLESSSGFITPIGIMEILNGNWTIHSDTNENSTQSSLKSLAMINDTGLYEIIENKASNLSERSLIFINKKLKALRLLPTNNRFQAFRDFVAQQPAAESSPRIVDDKNPQNTRKAQTNYLKTIERGQKVDINNSQLQSLYHRYIYPDISKQNAHVNKSCMFDVQDPAQMNANKKEMLKAIEQGMNFRNSDKAAPVLPSSSVDPELHSKNMVIKSYTNRKPITNVRNCGFLKPNSLHRMTFNKNLEDKLNPNDISGLDNYYIGETYGEEKLYRYIKETLSKLQTQISKSEGVLEKDKQGKSSRKEAESNIDSTEQKLVKMLEEISGD